MLLGSFWVVKVGFSDRIRVPTQSYGCKHVGVVTISCELCSTFLSRLSNPAVCTSLTLTTLETSLSTSDLMGASLSPWDNGDSSVNI